MANADAKPEDSDRPDAKQVRAHLGHVLAFSEFAAAPQLSAFLTYVVERKLEGAEHRIKAYTIATEALGRPPSFDPQADPIVRVQARRVRQALLAYYSQPDADDTIRISMPVGGYVPGIKSFTATVRHGEVADVPRNIPVSRLAYATLVVALLALGITLWSSSASLRTAWEQFSWQQPPTEINPLGTPALIVKVAAERQMPGWFQAGRFAKALEFNLSRFDEFVVLAPDAARPVAATDYELALEFTGTISSVFGVARLSKGGSGRIVWSERFRVPEDAIDQYEFLDAARRLASVLGQPYGVLYSQLLGDPGKTPAQACLLKGYDWFQNPVKEDIEPAIACLEQLLKQHPGNHIAHILLGYLYTERFRNRLGRDPEADLARAYAMALRSVALRPQSAGSQQVLMEVQTARGKEELALAAGQKAIELNPNDSDVLADYGCRLIFRGRYSEGTTFAERAARWNSLPPPWHLFCLFTAANNTGKPGEADIVAERLEGAAGPYALIPVIIAAGRRGDKIKARQAIESLIAYDSGFARDPKKPLELLGVFPEVAAPLIEGLRAAGLKS